MSAAKLVAVSESQRRRVELPEGFAQELLRSPLLGEAERSTLGGFFAEPIEYVHHELFDRPGAEADIMGPPGAGAFGDLLPPGEDGASLLDGEPPTAAQEILFFQRLNYARMRVARRLTEAELVGSPDMAWLAELADWVRRAIAIRDAVAKLTLPLVPAMAKQARFHSLDLNDLISEGNCALLRAIMTFDCSRGYRFSTYACRAILKSFSRVILRMTRYRNRFPMEYDPLRETADEADARRDSHHVDCIAELAVIMADNRAKLTEIEQLVIRQRFGLDAEQGGTPKTLEEIGEQIGVTKERVRQIQNKALRKLRAKMETSFLAA